MKKEVILVPKDKCPLDVLAEMGEQTNNSWIFLHDNAFLKLRKTCTKDISNSYRMGFYFEGSSDSPETIIKFTNFPHGDWFKVIGISANDLNFIGSEDPEEIFFLKMEE